MNIHKKTRMAIAVFTLLAFIASGCSANNNLKKVDNPSIDTPTTQSETISTGETMDGTELVTANTSDTTTSGKPITTNKSIKETSSSTSTASTATTSKVSEEPSSSVENPTQNVLYPPVTPGNYTFKTYSKLTEVSTKLPDPFIKPDGSRVSNLSEWNQQRDYIKQALCFYVYGKRPTFTIHHVKTDYQMDESDYGETTVYSIYYGDGTRYFRVRVTRPSTNKKSSYPVIMRYEDNMDYRFPIEQDLLTQDNYVIVAINHTDASPNNQSEYNSNHMKESEAKAIMAWAYEATLTLNFLDTLPYIDMSRIALTGHSRTGKAVICAAAFDDRIALAIPNSSGAGGASSFRTFGQSGAQGIGLSTDQPSWVSDNLAAFKSNVNKLPLDMNWATALIAPRPVLFTESRDGGDSNWAGPKGTYACWSALDEIYKIYGNDSEMVLRNLINTRSGQHDQLVSDYNLLVDFCNHYFYGKALNTAALRQNTEYPKAASQHKWTAPF